jgi:outer membrane protein assembly factor BamB
MNKLSLLWVLLLYFAPLFNLFSQKKDTRTEVEVLISSFLGNEKRNYYGNQAPEKLDTIWKLYLGEGISPAYGIDKVWKGAGWTGQPLLVRENNELYLIQGAFDYHLKKIKAKTGELVWQYKFEDILKGTGTIWVNRNESNPETKYIILQGSRLGFWNTHEDKYIPSYRGISYLTGKELWRINIKKTDCYSRDVDGSAVVVDSLAYLAFENGLFTVFSPNPKYMERLDGMMQPKILQEITYYNQNDINFHGDDLVSESSPTIINGRVFTLSGTGWVYGYNLLTRTNDWQYYIGTDMNGSAPATDDNCLLVPIEKQYMPGSGGVMKINPAKTGNDCVVWFYPTPDKKWFHWDGGIIGSISCNDAYVDNDEKHFAVFLDVSGELTVVDHQSLEKNKFVLGPDTITKFPCPKLIAKVNIPGTISTPIIVKNKIVAATDEGLYLFELVKKDKSYKLELLDKVQGLPFDATPIVWDGRVYVASCNGYMYCFGKKN